MGGRLHDQILITAVIECQEPLRSQASSRYIPTEIQIEKVNDSIVMDVESRFLELLNISNQYFYFQNIIPIMLVQTL